MEQASRTLTRLNLETRSLHEAADGPWLALLRRDVARLDYVRQLALIYGFEAPLEAAFAYTPNLKLMIDLRARSRAGYIAQDLLALGLSASEIAHMPQCFPIAPFGSPIEALGWMYVIERSTLTHEAIRRHVLARVPDAEGACAYLSAYRGVAGARWAELGQVLDRAAPTDDMADDLIFAAHAGFRTLIAWSRDERLARASGA